MQKMTFITRNCNTSYVDLLDMNVDDIDELFTSLIDLMNVESQKRKEAYEASRSKNG